MRVERVEKTSSKISPIDVEYDRVEIGKFHHDSILSCAVLKSQFISTVAAVQNQCF